MSADSVNDGQTRFKHRKRQKWEGVERIPLMFTKPDGRVENIRKTFLYIQRQHRWRRSTGEGGDESSEWEDAKEEEVEEEEGDVNVNAENPNSPPPPPSVLVRLVNDHPNLLITRGVKGLRVYDHEYESSDWWKELCDEVDGIISKPQTQRLSLYRIQNQKRTMVFVAGLGLVNGLLILGHAQIFGGGGQFLGLVEDLGVVIIWFAFVLFLAYGLLQFGIANRNETIILEKLGKVLTNASSKSSTCFVNTTTNEGNKDAIVEDVLTKDVIVTFNYRPQTWGEWWNKTSAKIQYGITKLFYDPPKKQSRTTTPPPTKGGKDQDDGFVDFTPPTITPNNNPMSGNYIEVRVTVTVSSYSPNSTNRIQGTPN